MSRWPFLPLAAIPLVLGFLRPAPSPALVWWTTHSLEKIRPYDRVPEHAPQSVKIQAARNEFEPFQVVLRAESPAIDAVDIEVTDLRGKSGVIPSAKYISAYLVRYLNLKTPSSVTGGTGEWPDPLVPRVDRYANERRNAFPFKLTAGRNQPIWIDVYVPPSTPAGLYSGHVNIMMAGKPRVSIPLDLEVWNFQLPSTSSLVTTFGFSGNSAVRAHYDSYTGSKDIEDLTRVYHRAALWHRISLDSNAGVAPALAIKDDHVQVSWDTYDSVVEPFMDGTVFTSTDPLSGARATSLGVTTPVFLLTTAEQRIEYWRQIAAHFREKGWFDRLFHYVWDEPQPKDFPALIELGKTAHRADPALKNLVAAPLDPNWSNVIDIWSPAINCFERKPFFGGFCNPMAERSAYDTELAKGKRLWWYQACGSHGCDIVGGDYFRGWPSYVIDDVAGPPSEVITADNIAAVAPTCLVPPQPFTLCQLRIVCGALRHRIAEAAEKRFSFEAIDRGRPNIDHIGPVRVERRRDQVLQRRIGTMRRFSEFNEGRKILRLRLIPNVVKETIEPALFPKMCGDFPPVFDSLSRSCQQEDGCRHAQRSCARAGQRIGGSEHRTVHERLHNAIVGS